MMKLSILMLCFLTFAACNSSEEEDDSPIATPTNKDTLSAWNVPNSAWAVRLDLGGANLTGTPFTLTYKFSDTSEITCTGSVLAGSEGSGSYQTGSCTDPGVTNPTNMANIVGAATFATGGAGTYTNNGTNLVLCKANTSCLTYQ